MKTITITDKHAAELQKMIDERNNLWEQGEIDKYRDMSHDISEKMQELLRMAE